MKGKKTNFGRGSRGEGREEGQYYDSSNEDRQKEGSKVPEGMH
jgi:hypothetical protein